MPEPVNVQTKLTLDDLASEGLKKIREGFEQVGDKVKETGHEMAGMIKQAAAFTIGFQLNGAIDSVKEFGEEILHNAAALQDENRELAGVIAMAEHGQKSFDELGREAGELNEHLARLAIDTGNAKGAMIDAFEMIAERTTKGADHVEDMVGKMAEAAKTMPGGITTLAGAWRDLESGIIRPRNQLVQLMRQMGLVHGSARDVANGLSQMVQKGQEGKVFDLAEKAIEKMSQQAKHLPMTFSQLMQSLGTFREELFETLGTPMVKSLGEEFRKLQGYLEGHRHEIEELAKTLGERVGQWVHAAAKLIQQGFDYLKNHAGEIMDALQNGAKALMTAVQFMVDHRQILMGLALANMAPGGIGGLGKAAGALTEALPGIGSAAGRAVGSVVAGGAAAGGAAAGAVAIAAWYGAYVEEQKLSNETGMSFTEMLRSVGHGLFGASDRIKDFDAKIQAFNREMQKDTVSMDELEHLEHGLEHLARGAELAGDSVDRFVGQLRRAREQLEHQAGVENAISRMEQLASGSTIFGGAQTLARAYAEASEADEKQADAAARRILAANGQLVAALGALSIDDAIKRLKDMASGKVAGGDIKLPPINFGPTTFHVVQDFRDQDPDRVMVMFRRDITRQATSRISSRLQTPFGY